MNLQALVERIRSRPDFPRAGMILVHNGVVRETARDGRRVRSLRVAVDRERLALLLERQRRRPGILDVQVEIAEGRELAVGEDVMLLAVAGDVRENVIAVLAETLELIKTTITHKVETFA